LIVYRDVMHLVEPRALLRECEGLLRTIADGRGADHALAVRLLIDFGELESAVVDTLCPSADDVSPVADLWRRGALAIGHLFVASWLQHGAERLRAAATGALSSISQLSRSLQAGALRLHVPEGYAYYGLYPETYVAAASLFQSGRKPGAAVCIGVRSIGTSLSAVVGAALEAEGWRVVPLTLRPRGHPFQRRPILSRELTQRLESQQQALFLIIDEGPGLSGSSFCGVAEVLSQLGVPDDRIALFPSWSADGSTFNSGISRERWRRHRRFCCSFEEAWLVRGVLGAELQDVSGGAWRSGCYTHPADYPAVHPQHERRKYLATLSSSGEQVLFKFAGLGRYGAAKHARAEGLAETGFTPPVFGLRDGFLLQTFAAGWPLCREDADARLLRAAARYLAHLRGNDAVEDSVCFESLAQMVEVNVVEGLGPAWRNRLGDLERFRAILAASPALAIDGRMMPHEWLATSRGILKADATDHGDDHFFPGPQDIAWDVAGFAIEFGLSRGAKEDFADAVSSLSGDLNLRLRLPFYAVAYLACRLGYVTLAAQTLGESPDSARMAALAQRYRRQLRLSIARLAVPQTSISVSTPRRRPHKMIRDAGDEQSPPREVA
jgi:hypothetical protein